MDKLLFFDVETNGLPLNWKASPRDIHNWPEILSIAWILTHKSGEIIEEGYYILDRSNGLFLFDEEAFKTHGISVDKMKKEGKNAAVVFGAFLNHLQVAEMVVCHNTAFDISVLIADLLRVGEVDLMESFSKKVKFCTMVQANNYWGKWPKLIDLFNHLYYPENPSLENANFHNARFDVWACAFIFFEMVSNPEKFRLFGEGYSIWENKKPSVDLQSFQIQPFAKLQ